MATIRKLPKELIEWRDARAAFLSLESGSPDRSTALDRLAKAEDTLFRFAREIGGAP